MIARIFGLLISLSAVSLAAQPGKTALTADAFYARGKEVHGQNELAKAIAYYTEALERDGGHTEALYDRAMAYFSRSQWSKAAADLDALLRLKPRDREALERRGYVAYLLNRYDEAADYYTRALQIADAARLRTNRGVAFLDGNNPERALEDFRMALRLDSAFVDAWVGLGNTHLALGEYEKALRYLNTALKHGCKDARVYNNMDVAQAGLGHFEKAVAGFTQVLGGGENPEVLSQRAYCYYRMGDVERARADALRASNLDVKNVNAYNTLGLLELGDEKFELAEKIFAEALIWQPQNAELRFGRGYARYKMRDFGPALEDLNVALQFAPNYGEARYTRACVRLMLADRTGACEDYRRAQEDGYEPFTEEDSSVFCDGVILGADIKQRQRP